MNKEAWIGVQIGANGSPVAEVEDTDSDRAVMLIRLEDDGITVYGCTWDGCDFTSTSLFGVAVAHRKKHEPPVPKPPKPKGPRIPYGDMTLQQIIEELDEKDADITRLTEQLERLAEANTRLRAELGALQRLRSAAKRVLDA